MMLSQNISICDTISFKVIESEITFSNNSFSSNDSSLIIPVVNNSVSWFPYPIATVTPINLDSSLYCLNCPFNVFGNPWMPGDTLYINMLFEVYDTIAENYVLNFNLFISNLENGAGFFPNDTCVFQSTFAVNLNSTTPSNDNCYLIPDPGPCFAAIPIYFYNQNTNQCEETTWGGCYGLVPFWSLSDCENNCNNIGFSNSYLMKEKSLLKIIDIFGREVDKLKKKQIMFYIYNDGTVEKIFQ